MNVMKCGNCGAGLAPGAGFCAACGAAAERRCPNCGAVAGTGAFCSTCGAALDSAAPRTAVRAGGARPVLLGVVALVAVAAIGAFVLLSKDDKGSPGTGNAGVTKDGGGASGTGAPSLAELRDLGGKHGLVTSLAFTPDGKRALSGARAGTALWDLDTGSLLRSFPIDSATAVAFTPDGKRAVVGTADAEIYVMDVDTGRQVGRIFTDDAVTSLSISADGRQIVAGHLNDYVILFDLEPGGAFRRFDGLGGDVVGAELSRDGRRVVAADDYASLAIVWDAQTGRELHRLDLHHDSLAAFALLADGKTALVATYDYFVIWDVETGKELRRAPVDNLGATDFELRALPDGRYALFSDDDNNLRFWDIERGVDVANLLSRFPDSTITALAVSADGKRALVGGSGGTIRLYSISR